MKRRRSPLSLKAVCIGLLLIPANAMWQMMGLRVGHRAHVDDLAALQHDHAAVRADNREPLREKSLAAPLAFHCGTPDDLCDVVPLDRHRGAHVRADPPPDH